MSHMLITLTGVAYLCVACEQAWKGNTGVALMFAGYAAAQVGIYMQAV